MSRWPRRADSWRACRVSRGAWKPHPKSFPLGHLAQLVARQNINHLIHHRGQLTVYLRLLDVPLPSIYGPTADEKW